MKTRIEFHSDVESDLNEIANRDLHARAIELLERLKLEPDLGLPLDNKPYTGDLSRCRKLYFAKTKNEPPTHRIVYRLILFSETEVLVQVIAVGERRQSAVYRTAAKRLNEK